MLLLRTMVAVLLASALPGCASRPVAPPPVPRASPPVATTPAQPPAPQPGTQPGTQIGSTASGGRITLNDGPPAAAAVVDSTPSEDALAVLRTIPEPLGDGARTDRSGVPVPAPTRSLGDPAGARPSAALPESPGAGTAPSSAPAAPAVPPDSCWRVQVLAPPEADRADRMAEAARSQLLVPFVVEREDGLFKVRSRDCLAPLVANDLRRRAIESGFEGAFRFPAKPR